MTTSGQDGHADRPTARGGPHRTAPDGDRAHRARGTIPRLDRRSVGHPYHCDRFGRRGRLPQHGPMCPFAEAVQRVSNERRTRNRRPIATLAVALWVALLVVLANVAPALAVEGPTKLDNQKVSPRSGSPSTTIVFEVRYRNREGSAPDHINVLIDGTAHRMTGDGSTWKQGVVVRWSGTLPVGAHSVRFEAADTRKFTDAVDGGSVTITKPTPTPTPTPKPTPTPTPTPKPTPTPTPRPTPTPTPTPT